MTEAGEVLESVQIINDADRLTEVISRAGQTPEVVLEATYGWYSAVDALQAAGASMHLRCLELSGQADQSRIGLPGEGNHWHARRGSSLLNFPHYRTPEVLGSTAVI
jgi:hypothetical protein